MSLMTAQASAPVIVWFRNDLRVTDNPALDAAVGSGRGVICLYILDPEERPSLGGASRWWLHGSLASLSRSLEDRGARLVLRRGPAAATLQAVIEEAKACAVFWNRCYDPASVIRDTALKADLSANGHEVRSFKAGLLHEPWEIRSKSGESFRVFSAFWRACALAPEPGVPLPAPRRIPQAAIAPASDPLEALDLLPTRPDWAGGLRRSWTPGEAGAMARLDAFLDSALGGYRAGRDLPGQETTSRLSPHLRFGEISPRQVWTRVRLLSAHSADAEKFLAEIGWREFSYHLLFHFPDLAHRNLRPAFDRFAWSTPGAELPAWQKGRTGYPIVDAGMRELWETGWMHNRVRMITASFLVKHLLIPWQAGEAWFWDTLVDADPASNPASWQWVAGSGADAAPYFRIFNPVLQGEKFDADGAYVRRWVPELGRLPDRWLHRPWEAPREVLAGAGVELGRTYPHPVVDHGWARDRALSAFARIKGPETA